MIALSYSELDKLPPAPKSVDCPHCKKRHKTKEAKDKDNVPLGIFSYRCKGSVYIVGMKGKDIRSHLTKR